MAFEAREFPKKVKSTFHLDEDDIPELGDINLDDKIKVEAVLKLKSLNKFETEDEVEKKSYIFEITTIDIVSGLKKVGDVQSVDGRVI